MEFLYFLFSVLSAFFVGEATLSPEAPKTTIDLSSRSLGGKGEGMSSASKTARIKGAEALAQRSVGRNITPEKEAAAPRMGPGLSSQRLRSLEIPGEAVSGKPKKGKHPLMTFPNLPHVSDGSSRTPREVPSLSSRGGAAPSTGAALKASHVSSPKKADSALVREIKTIAPLRVMQSQSRRRPVDDVEVKKKAPPPEILAGLPLQQLEGADFSAPWVGRAPTHAAVSTSVPEEAHDALFPMRSELQPGYSRAAQLEEENAQLRQEVENLRNKLSLAHLPEEVASGDSIPPAPPPPAPPAPPAPPPGVSTAAPAESKPFDEVLDQIRQGKKLKSKDERVLAEPITVKNVEQLTPIREKKKEIVDREKEIAKLEEGRVKKEEERRKVAAKLGETLPKKEREKWAAKDQDLVSKLQELERDFKKETLLLSRSKDQLKGLETIRKLKEKKKSKSVSEGKSEVENASPQKSPKKSSAKNADVLKNKLTSGRGRLDFSLDPISTEN